MQIRQEVPLSEAMRLGAMLRPQGFGLLHEREKTSCANGAAMEAVGMRNTIAPIWAVWPWVNQPGKCPECGKVNAWCTVIAACLNDTHEWTREQIADWVATIEPADQPTILQETQEPVGVEG